jgi:uncharacterized protein
MHEPNSFTWGELLCRDIDAAKDFYGAVFGWEGRTPGVAESSTYTEFFLPDVDQAVAGMVQMNQRWPEDVPPHWMLYFTSLTPTRSSVASANSEARHPSLPMT